MNNIYLIVALGFCIIVMIKLLYNKIKTNQKQVNDNTLNQISTTLNDGNIKVATNKKEIENKSLHLTDVNPEIISKNSWLYPTDEFGKMENGVNVD